MVQQVRAHRTEDSSRHPTEPSRAHDHKVGVLGFMDQHMAGLAADELGGYRYVSVDMGEQSVDGIRKSLFGGATVVVARAERREHPGMDDHELAAALASLFVPHP
jgi:hypothetical protein